ncbi:MAG: ParB/RepB/Spo0J family partition protein [Deltaproteobacteria bacterium]|nr:ParB/RepB/Spo0J family partition protein [Deltaproteobacteria bacterium]MBN2846595.1 ParB/RepB/Spo0J family partition protein [Deltaproteobacteria bacterium]
MAKKNALGKGLGAIFTDLVDDASGKPMFSVCGIEELSPNRFQPRKVFDGDEEKSLVASIKKNGIIQPIIVRKSNSGYEIIAGERRWRAAQAAGMKDVPIIIREAEDIDIAEISLIENIQREELNPVEEAEAYQTLVGKFKLSQEEISSRVGKDRTTIANFMRLLRLPPEAKEALARKTISTGHGRSLLSLDSKDKQITTLKEILRKKLSVRETERLVKRLSTPEGKKKKQQKSSSLLDIEERLARKFMTKVNIRQSKRGGTLEIRFLSNEDLDRLLNIIIKE